MATIPDRLKSKVPPVNLRSRRRRIVLAAAVVLLAAGLARPLLRDHAFPSSEWSRGDPAEAGFDGAILQSLTDRIGGSGCIVHEGRMIHAWGNYTARGDIASAMKPLIGHFTLKAVEEGLIPSLDQPVADWVPELESLNPDLGYKDRKITFRHLLDQTSGYALAEPPGEAFAYNDLSSGLLLWTLVNRVYDCGYGGIKTELIQNRLGRWLQFEDSPTMMHERSWPGRLRISSRDLARFGHLYLNEGNWHGHAVLSSELVRRALNSPLPPRFPRTAGQEAEQLKKAHSLGGSSNMSGHGGWLSRFWWINQPNGEGELLFPAAPAGTFAAVGHGGKNALIVIPEYDLVVAWIGVFGANISTPFKKVGRWRVNEAIDELLKARREPS